MRTAHVVIIYDVSCPNCSRIARELPDLVRVPVTVLSCRNPRLGGWYPTLPAPVLACGTPAVGAVAEDDTVRWWTGLRGAAGLLPVVRPGRLREAAGLLLSALRTTRAR
ncbi:MULTISPECIES: hypothetical protein [unclassified Pseudonocardia]|uniref:hypothetical protein n=1 Tax=unclassified Pseudonocardia TaxID=2619320 RepID=UPI0025F9C867|nr:MULTISPECIES: hypothetical protein [unclassified Pseudonocardia]